MSNLKFRKIVIMGRSRVETVPTTLMALQAYLTSLNIETVLVKETAALLGDQQLPCVDSKDLPPDSDLIIVVGGDGSLLHAARVAIANDLPILGINRGRLGFLTDIHPDELTKICAILNGFYQQETRFLLNAKLLFEDRAIKQDIALNDVVLLPGDVAQMIEFDILIDGQFVCSQRADGLIIATPTGSTAYALSGGGPILHPALDALVLVPMFPHTLGSRPIVVSSHSSIDVVICKQNETSPYISCDGQNRTQINPGSRLHVTKKQRALKLIHPEDYNYYTTLREKLGWERHEIN